MNRRERQTQPHNSTKAMPDLLLSEKALTKKNQTISCQKAAELPLSGAGSSNKSKARTLCLVNLYQRFWLALYRSSKWLLQSVSTNQIEVPQSQLDQPYREAIWSNLIGLTDQIAST